MNKEALGGVGGVMISALGTGIQTNELLQTISLILTIIGTVITIVMALMSWWNRSKKDGKISIVFQIPKELIKRNEIRLEILADGDKIRLTSKMKVNIARGRVHWYNFPGGQFCSMYQVP